MKKILAILICMILVQACVDKKLHITFRIHNELQEDVKMTAFYIPFNSLEPIVSSEHTILAGENLIIEETSYSEQNGPILIHSPLRVFFDLSVDSLTLTFTDGSVLSMRLIQDYSAITPEEKTLNIFCDLLDFSCESWTTENTGKNRIERTYQITQAHKDAAN